MDLAQPAGAEEPAAPSPATRDGIVEAVAAVVGPADAEVVARRAAALARLIDTDDGRDALAAYRRAAAVVRSEEVKDGTIYRGHPDPHLYLQREERELAAAIHVAKQTAAAAVAREDLAAALHALAALAPKLAAFFAKVNVHVAMSDRRENRLKLLAGMREATRAVADFSKIEAGTSPAR
jgi:glycyl-tRNA synthetase beta chain